MKVLLIVPPGVEADLPPLGPMYIAAVIRKICDVKIYDCGVQNITFEDLPRIIKKEKPDLVGVGPATSPRIYYYFKTLRIIKKINPNIKTLIGGPHASAVPSIIKYNFMDFLVRGEGEFTVKELIQNFNKPKNYKKILGLSFKQNKKVIHNKPRSLIKDLDKLPFPARDLVPTTKYQGSIMPLALPETNVIGSRGCPYLCSYCFKGIFGATFRQRNPKKVVDEVEYLVKTYNIKTINFFDDDINLDPKYLANLCDEIIKRKLNHIKYKGQARVNKNLITLELLKKMKKAGFYLICYGIESCNQRVLNRNHKGITLEEIKRTAKLTRKAGIRSLGFFMMGNLGEDLNTLEDTIQFASKLPLDYAQVTIAMPYPGTEFYEVAKKKGWLGAEFETDPHLTYRTITIKNRPELPYEEMQKKLRRFYIKFFFKPTYILRTLIRMFSSMDDFRLTLKGLGWILDALSLTTKIERKRYGR